MRITAAGLMIAIGLVGAFPSAAQDWPYWRGAERRGRVTGFATPAVWPETLVRRWRAPVGLGDATPALVGNRLYAFGRQGDQEVITCLAADDGREIWRHGNAAVAVTGPAEKYAGPRSSPAIVAGRVVVLGVGGVLSCVDADTGQLVWRHEALAKAVPRFFTAGSPLVTEGLCVIHLGGKDEGVVFALELATGRTRWQWAGAGPAYASPVLATVNDVTQVVLPTENSLLALSLAEGNRLWQVPTALKQGYWNSVTPVVDGAIVFYTGQGTGTRALRIEARDGAFAQRELWHNADVGTVYNTPVLKDGALYGLSPRGQFFCLDAATGATKWLATERHSNFGALVDAGEVLVALVEKTGLVIFRPNQERYEEVARYPVSDKPVYAFPVLAGRRIFIRDADTVALWLLPEK